MTNDPALFDTLRTILRERAWSVPYFARQCDVSVQLAYKWLAEDESGRITPAPRSCAKIATALSLDPDYVLKLAGHRQSLSTDRPVDPDRAELEARLSRLGERLSPFPRPFWLAVMDASERLAEALDALPDAELPTATPVPPVERPTNGRRRRATIRPGEDVRQRDGHNYDEGKNASEGPLAGNYSSPGGVRHALTQWLVARTLMPA